MPFAIQPFRSSRTVLLSFALFALAANTAAGTANSKAKKTNAKQTKASTKKPAKQAAALGGGPNYPDCPFTLADRNDVPRSGNRHAVVEDGSAGSHTRARTREFVQAAAALRTGASSPRQCVQQVARAAVQCGVNMLDCGHTGNTINQICGVHGKGREHRSIYSVNRSLWSWVYCSGQFSAHRHRTNCPSPWSGTSCPGHTTPPAGVCYVPSVQDAYRGFRAAIPGYPDNWANELQPGDRVMVYNDNGGDDHGFHTLIFTGWKSPGWANVVQGSNLMVVGDQTLFGGGARGLCLMDRCHPSVAVVQTWRPE